MNETQLKEIIFSVLEKIAPDADLGGLGPNENLRDALDIDSFDHLNFLIGLHEKLGLEIPEADYGRLNTLEEIVHYLTVHA